MAPNKMIHLNFFDISCVSNHMNLGLWKAPGDNTRTKDSIEYYTWLAQLAEKGKITCIFFADTYGVEEYYGGVPDYAYLSGAGVATLDPTIYLSCMAAVTKSVSFGITGSTTYLNPYILARTWSSMDHASKGRVAWNVVTSYGDYSAKAMGRKKITPHDERYNEAHEYMDLMYSIWEGSWEDGAQIWDPEVGAYDPSKIHKITFNGKYFDMIGQSPTHPGPQRTPVLFQAGSSKAGKEFGAKHAEALFISGRTPEGVAPFVKEMRDLAASFGRDPKEIKLFPMITPILGRTLEEAQAKRAAAEKLADYRGGLMKVSSFLGMDLSKFPLDEPFDMGDGLDSAGVQTMFTVLKAITKGIPTTPRQLGTNFAFCGFGDMPTGTPEMVADRIADWANIGDIDGFNLAYVSNPGSYEDIVELLVPVLQERGLMWKDYVKPGGTFRENLHNRPGKPHLPEEHTGAQFRYEKLKETAVLDALGNVTINKVPKETDEVVETPEEEEAPEVKHINGVKDSKRKRMKV